MTRTPHRVQARAEILRAYALKRDPGLSERLELIADLMDSAGILVELSR